MLPSGGPTEAYVELRLGLHDDVLTGELIIEEVVERLVDGVREDESARDESDADHH